MLIGRPNVGKSTFLNNLIGTKVAITSPKPQTTRFPIKALYEEARGTVIFIDTPGIFAKAEDAMSKKINQKTLSSLNEEVDLVIYMVDHTRKRDFEEGKVLGIVRKIEKPKILVVNKIDKPEPTYLPQYKFLEEEFKDVFLISALNRTHVKPLLDRIFELLPDQASDNTEEKTDETGTGDGKEETQKGVSPLLNIDSRIYVAELIREKVFLMMGEEIPYTTTAIVDEITERSNGMMYVKARILTTDSRYKKMLIGAGGRKIKEIGSYARKEIALATGKKVYLDLSVQTDPHWQETYF